MTDAANIAIRVEPAITIPWPELELSYARSSGPGGQNVNKVNSKCVLRWDALSSPSLPLGARARFLERYASRLTDAGVLVLTSDRFRDQARNVDDCLEKLAEMLRAVARPPKARKATQPTHGSRKRRLKEKSAHSEKKARRRTDWD